MIYRFSAVNMAGKRYSNFADLWLGLRLPHVVGVSFLSANNGEKFFDV